MFLSISKKHTRNLILIDVNFGSNIKMFVPVGIVIILFYYNKGPNFFLRGYWYPYEHHTSVVEFRATFSMCFTITLLFYHRTYYGRVSGSVNYIEPGVTNNLKY